jgi:hypothetical protein
MVGLRGSMYAKSAASDSTLAIHLTDRFQGRLGSRYLKFYLTDAFLVQLRATSPPIRDSWAFWLCEDAGPCSPDEGSIPVGATNSNARIYS